MQHSAWDWGLTSESCWLDDLKQDDKISALYFSRVENEDNDISFTFQRLVVRIRSDYVQNECGTVYANNIQILRSSLRL